MGKFTLVVSSRVHLDQSQNLAQPAYELGQLIAKEYILLTLSDLNLTYKVAQGTKDKEGLSIGFSPAESLRHHIINKQLPTDVYDWLYYSNLKTHALISDLIHKGQGLILIGATLQNMSELALALEINLPVGVLLDSQEEKNNSLMIYLKTLPLTQQRTIILHHKPDVLLQGLTPMINKNNWDLNEEALLENNQAFKEVFQKITKPPKASSES